MMHKFSEKAFPLFQTTTFPVNKPVGEAFKSLKQELANAVVRGIDEDVPFEVKIDASDTAIAAALNQNGRSVALFLRVLNQSEQNHSSVKKEACAIVEALQKWKHYLTGRHFNIITDQSKKMRKIKNDKIMRWRVVMSCYSYDKKYRPGNEITRRCFIKNMQFSNWRPAALTGSAWCTLSPWDYPRFFHFIKSRNLPYSLEDVKHTVSHCGTCAVFQVFFKPPKSTLIKATQPYDNERRIFSFSFCNSMWRYFI